MRIWHVGSGDVPSPRRRGDSRRSTLLVGHSESNSSTSWWMHLTADHTTTFRIVPDGPTSTQVTTTWLVPAGAVEDLDYDVATPHDRVERDQPAQDALLVERTQHGVGSPACRPGPYSMSEEAGVIEFVEWYCTAMLGAMGAQSTTQPPDEEVRIVKC